MHTPFTRTRRARGATQARSPSLGDALTVLSLVGIVAGSWNACMKVHRARLAERAALPSELIETWEAEGGRLPGPRAPADQGQHRRDTVPE